MTPCPICGELLYLTELSFRNHYRKVHPGERPPNLRRANVPKYDDTDRFLIENAVRRRDYRHRKYGWRRGA